jgi:hypothetical protein
MSFNLVAQQRIFKIEMDRLNGHYLEEGHTIPTSNGHVSGKPAENVFAPTPTITEAVTLYMDTTLTGISVPMLRRCWCSSGSLILYRTRRPRS